MLKTSLPKSITLPCGTVLNKRVSHGSGIGFNKREILGLVKARGGKYRAIEVLERNLRGRRDLRGNAYTPSEWVMTDVDISTPV